MPIQKHRVAIKPGELPSIENRNNIVEVFLEPEAGRINALLDEVGRGPSDPLRLDI